ncbi:MAG TPA: PhzF family phenazine biosynthesis protein [Thermomicrobiales bacterium]|nr:PhzF family phenazine biosynthesis protein [Thermomicrobiales bacterium]
MGQSIVQVDAFADRPFAGNPAGVCVLAAPADAAWMQQVAREMNLAETAFLYPEDDGYRLRWFTPTIEVDLCGHATLASAHVLWSEGYLPAGAQARFQTLSGLLTADRRGDWIELDFPAEPAAPAAPPPNLVEALGVAPVEVGRNRVDFIVEVADEQTVRGVQPDMSRLTAVPTRGVIVTSRAEAPEIDFVSRFFAPAAGIPEDPVTGSAHCCLGPFWGARLGKDELVGYQASARGGVVRVRLAGDRVKLLGQAVTVIRGELVGAAGESGGQPS